MVTVVIVSNVDPSRPSTTYRVEVPEDGVKTWLEPIQAKARDAEAWHVSMQKVTVSIIVRFDGAQWATNYDLTREELFELLRSADYDFPVYDGKPGRPAKRVLLMSTSKDRREGKDKLHPVSY